MSTTSQRDPTDDDLTPELQVGDAARGITRGERKLRNAAAGEGPLPRNPGATVHSGGGDGTFDEGDDAADRARRGEKGEKDAAPSSDAGVHISTC